MAHTHHHHREHQVSHRRVHKILEEHGHEAKHHAMGEHAHAFSKVTSKTAAGHHDHVHGHKGAKRYARGGKVKGKGHQTNIAIVMPHHSAPPTGGPPAPGAAPGGLPPGGPPPLPMGGPPGMPPPGGPPGMPMHKRGGKVHIDGESTKPNIKKWAARAHGNKSYARGGGLPTAGAATGVGRIESAELVRRKKGK